MVLTRAEISKRYRHRNPEKVRASMYAWRYRHMNQHLAICKKYLDSRRAIIREAKSKPCSDCYITYPYYVMDFDHVRGIKKNDVAKMCSSSIEALKTEIAKCEVVCANCHRIRTQERKNNLTKRGIL
jgi:hypothetical protein